MDKNKASEIITKNIKNYMSVFINRVSKNIEDRIIYYFKIKKNLNLKKPNYCIKFYKNDIKTAKPKFRLGSNIILDKPIGSTSMHATIYYSIFRDKNKRLYKFAIKTTPITKITEKEVIILQQLTELIITRRCPHFPIIYSIIKCDNNDMNDSSYIKSSSNKSISKIPIFHYNKYYSILTELANGDVKTFMKNHNKEIKLVKNALAQIWLSLIFYYKYTNNYHSDAHDGNFLYHKIKSGGYFHYKIYEKDYYLKNEGYLWIIWDLEQSKPLDSLLGNHYELLDLTFDFKTINYYFTNHLQLKDSKEIKRILKNTIKYTPTNLKILIEQLLNYLVKTKILRRKINEKPINNIPYN